MVFFSRKIRTYFFIAAIIGSIFIFANPVFSDSLGQQVKFFVDPNYEISKRSQVTATLREVGDFVYFYVEDNYWGKILPERRKEVENALKNLANEFDKNIYPKEREIFGSEWTPGIDNDKRITVLVLELKEDAGGYWNGNDEYSKNLIPTSNQREMVYLNAKYITSPIIKAYLAHEFQHVITFYQKTKLWNTEEEVWLNEARSEYAPTLCGYDDVYQGSNLSRRVEAFWDYPSDSLTEWKNKSADYGVVNLFIHYLVDQYGEKILTRMMQTNKVGIESINYALKSLGYSEDFKDVFANWAIANYLNDCSVNKKYCYLNPNLTYQVVHISPSASYSGFPYLIVNRTSSVKDWSSYWYKFDQSSPSSNEKDTLQLKFKEIGPNADFVVPYILIYKNKKPEVKFMNLIDDTSTIYISGFGEEINSVVIVPINTYKKSGFTENEPYTTFSFTALSVKGNLPEIEKISPSVGLETGGFPVDIYGKNLDSVKSVFFGDIEINEFDIVNGEKITFIAPSHSQGKIKVKLVTDEGEEIHQDNAFLYIPKFSDGTTIKAKNDYKVYVIKGKYKRWIESDKIFNSYLHLKWSDVVEVEPEVLDAYQTSWLIRADNDYKVYEVTPDGIKRWLNMTPSEFEKSGRKWEMVYIVNNFERDFYNTGKEITII